MAVIHNKQRWKGLMLRQLPTQHAARTLIIIQTIFTEQQVEILEKKNRNNNDITQHTA